MIAGVTALVFAHTTIAQQVPAGPTVAFTAPSKATPVQKRPGESEGERVFATNCSRCHTAPEGFPQSISGTIVRHMRVRASLSEHEEQALLRFLAPQ